MTKNEFFSKAIKWTQKQGYSDIKANFGDFEPPTSYTQSSENEVFVPDITANGQSGKNYIEIAMKTDDKRRLISKLKLLSTLSSLKDGRLIVLAPHGHKAFAQKIIEQHQFSNTRLVSLR